MAFAPSFFALATSEFDVHLSVILPITLTLKNLHLNSIHAKTNTLNTNKYCKYFVYKMIITTISFLVAVSQHTIRMQI